MKHQERWWNGKYQERDREGKNEQEIEMIRKPSLKKIFKGRVASRWEALDTVKSNGNLFILCWPVLPDNYLVTSENISSGLVCRHKTIIHRHKTMANRVVNGELRSDIMVCCCWKWASLNVSQINIMKMIAFGLFLNSFVNCMFHRNTKALDCIAGPHCSYCTLSYMILTRHHPIHTQTKAKAP